MAFLCYSGVGYKCHDLLLTYLLTYFRLQREFEKKAEQEIYKLENMAIASALQLEAARATRALSAFNYDAMPSLKSLNLSIAIL